MLEGPIFEESVARIIVMALGLAAGHVWTRIKKYRAQANEPAAVLSRLRVSPRMLKRLRRTGIPDHYGEIDAMRLKCGRRTTVTVVLGAFADSAIGAKARVSFKLLPRGWVLYVSHFGASQAHLEQSSHVPPLRVQAEILADALLQSGLLARARRLNIVGFSAGADLAILLGESLARLNMSRRRPQLRVLALDPNVSVATAFLTRIVAMGPEAFDAALARLATASVCVPLRRYLIMLRERSEGYAGQFPSMGQAVSSEHGEFAVDGPLADRLRRAVSAGCAVHLVFSSDTLSAAPDITEFVKGLATPETGSVSVDLTSRTHFGLLEPDQLARSISSAFPPDSDTGAESASRVGRMKSAVARLVHRLWRVAPLRAAFAVTG